MSDKIEMTEREVAGAIWMAQAVFQTVKQLHEEGITVFLVEQNVLQTLEIADYAYVIENGRIVKEGDGSAMLKDDYIKQAYLGI